MPLSNYRLQYESAGRFAMIRDQVVSPSEARMRSEFHPGRYWAVLGCSFACGAVFLLLAAALALQAWQGHGSHPGNILRVGFAVVSLFMGFFFIIVGALYRASSREPGGR